MLSNIIRYYKKRDLTGTEIERLVGKGPILYSDLGKYKNLDELLGPENYCIVLYQTSSRTTGHFVAITRNDFTGQVSYNDSYGIKSPDEEIQYTPYDKPLPKYLTRLLQGTDYISNNVDYQATGKVSTCGRWSSLFCLLRNLSQAQFRSVFKGNPGINSDDIATELTLLALNDISEYFFNQQSS
jgi:hypothetical protein